MIQVLGIFQQIQIALRILHDKVVETEEHATEATSRVVRKAKKAASVAFEKAKETVYEYEERVKDVVGLGDTKEKVSE
uniref:Uncharacterized protein n=1 Tax=Tanacetum cinerariifolium TaxID=118510 RepID=A0A6L2P1J7_TANCI|nr:hypothetical protein [Tanacetum cinerariifolium]